MTGLIRFFHYLSFAKYPLLLLALYFIYRPVLNEEADVVSNFNNGLIFMGLGLGLDSLKDYKKLNWLDRQVLHRPKIARIYLAIMALVIFSFIVMGIKAYFSSETSALKEVSIGLIVFGIGAIGFLKSGIEAAKDGMEQQNP